MLSAGANPAFIGILIGRKNPEMMHALFVVNFNEKAVCTVLSPAVCLLPGDDYAGRPGL
jgi:hypothetical protein